MTRRFYISTRKDRSAEGEALSHALIEHGWVCTFNWGSLAEPNPLDLERIALDEIEGVRQSDVLIVLLPGGFGTHVEIGAAIAYGKPIVLHSPSEAVLETPYRCVFHYHPLVKIIVSERLDLDAVLNALPR